MLNGKEIITHLIAGLIRKMLNKILYEPCEPFGGDINAKSWFIKLCKKVDLKNATEIYTSKLTLKSNLASLKAKVEKLDNGKLKTVPIDLSKLSNVVNNDIVKKTVYHKLVAKVNNIDISGLVLKTKYEADKSI